MNNEERSFFLSFFLSLLKHYFDSARNQWQSSPSYYTTTTTTTSNATELYPLTTSATTTGGSASSSSSSSSTATATASISRTATSSVVNPSSVCLSLSPVSIQSLEQISLLHHHHHHHHHHLLHRGLSFFIFIFDFYFGNLDERSSTTSSPSLKDLRSLSMSSPPPLPVPHLPPSTSSNKSLLIFNYPRIYSSSSPGSPISLSNDHETVHFDRSSPPPLPVQQQQQQQSSVNLSVPSYADLTPVLHSTPLPSFETLNSN